MIMNMNDGFILLDAKEKQVRLGEMAKISPDVRQMIENVKNGVSPSEAISENNMAEASSVTIAVPVKLMVKLTGVSQGADKKKLEKEFKKAIVYSINNGYPLNQSPDDRPFDWFDVGDDYFDSGNVKISAK